jgi:hypothetical protein
VELPQQVLLLLLLLVELPANMLYCLLLFRTA